MADYSTLDPLVTAADLATYMGGQLSATDPRIEQALDGVSTAIRRYCGWHITPSVTETIDIDADGGTYIDLPSKHVTAVIEVRVKRDIILRVRREYDWSPLGSLIRIGGVWPDRYRSVHVTLTHGWDQAPDVARVALAVVARELSSPSGVTREQAGGVSMSYATTSPGVSGGVALLAPEMAILDPYRIASV